MNGEKNITQVIRLRTYAEDLNRVRAEKGVKEPVSKKETGHKQSGPPQPVKKPKYIPPQKSISEEKKISKATVGGSPLGDTAPGQPDTSREVFREKKISIPSKPPVAPKKQRDSKKLQETVENISLENPPFHSIRATSPAKTSLTRGLIGKKSKSITEEKSKQEEKNENKTHIKHSEPKPKFQIDVDKSLVGYKKSILTDKESVFEVHIAQDIPEEGTIIKDTKRERFNLFSAIMASLRNWFNEKKIDIREARKPKHTVTPAHARKDVIKEAAKQSKRMPKDDHKIIKERLKLLPRATKHEGVNIKKSSEVPKTTWKHIIGEDETSSSQNDTSILLISRNTEVTPKKQESEFKIKPKEISEKFQSEMPKNIPLSPETPSAETEAAADKLENVFTRDEYHTLQKNIAKKIDTRDKKEDILEERQVTEVKAERNSSLDTSKEVPEKTKEVEDVTLPTDKHILRDTFSIEAETARKETYNIESVKPEEISKKPEREFFVAEVDEMPKNILLETHVPKGIMSETEIPEEAPEPEENLSVVPVNSEQAEGVDNTVLPDEQFKEKISETPEKAREETSEYEDGEPEEEDVGYAIFRKKHPLEKKIFEPTTTKPEKVAYRDESPPKPQPPSFNRRPVPQDRLATKSTPAPKPIRFPFNFLTIGIIAVILVPIVGFTLWWFLGNQTDDPFQIRSIPQLVDARVQISIPLGTSRNTLLNTMIEKSKISAGVSQLYPVTLNEDGVEEPSNTRDIVALLALRAPGSFQRSITNITFGSLDDTSPFIIIKASSFDEAFSGMLTWEKNMSADLTPLFGSVVTRSFDKDARTVDKAREPFFRDISISNHDARVLVDESENERIVYTFNDKHTILITTSAKALTTLIPLAR